jgi:hypothetical protein
MSDPVTSSLTDAFNSINSALTNATNAVNSELAQINALSLGNAKINVGFMTLQNVEGPVGPGATLNIASNTGSVLLLQDPLHFQGTIDFTRPAGAPNGSPSYVGLSGIPADSWSYANNALTLFAGGNVTDTVKLVNDPVGFGVFRANGGTVVGSAATPVASSLTPRGIAYGFPLTGQRPGLAGSEASAAKLCLIQTMLGSQSRTFVPFTPSARGVNRQEFQMRLPCSGPDPAWRRNVSTSVSVTLPPDDKFA